MPVFQLQGQGEHLLVAVDTNHAAGGPDDLGQDVADLAATRTQVDDHLARLEQSLDTVADALRANTGELDGELMEAAIKEANAFIGRLEES